MFIRLLSSIKNREFLFTKLKTYKYKTLTTTIQKYTKIASIKYLNSNN